MTTPFEEQVDDFLQAHTTLTLATWTPQGPQAAPLFYAHAWITDAAGETMLCFYFISNPTSNHCLAFETQPTIAAAIYQDGQEWRQIRGLQLEGRARRATPGADAQQATMVYFAKFPFVAAAQTGAPDGPLELAGPLAESAFYVIEADWLRLIDNTLGFGHREEQVY